MGSKICATIVATNINFDVEKTRNKPTPSGRQVTKKSASSEVRPKLALPPETETANRKNFGLLQTVGRVHRLRGEKPKTTNLWDLTEILYNAPKTNQKRRPKILIQTNLLPGKIQLWTEN